MFAVRARKHAVASHLQPPPFPMPVFFSPSRGAPACNRVPALTTSTPFYKSVVPFFWGRKCQTGRTALSAYLLCLHVDPHIQGRSSDSAKRCVFFLLLLLQVLKLESAGGVGGTGKDGNGAAAEGGRGGASSNLSMNQTLEGHEGSVVRHENSRLVPSRTALPLGYGCSCPLSVFTRHRRQAVEPRSMVLSRQHHSRQREWGMANPDVDLRRPHIVRVVLLASLSAQG